MNRSQDESVPTTVPQRVRSHGNEPKVVCFAHFRNIRGKRDDFQEVYPDEGDMDMLRVALTLHEVGYEFMLMPDHVPGHPDDPQGLQAFAFAYGYIAGILQAVADFG